MIEIVKQRSKKINEKYLNFITPWFNKSIIKNEKNILKWLNRFSYKDVINSLVEIGDAKKIDYNNFLGNVDKSYTLLINKQNDMLKELKIIRKLKKMLEDFGKQQGLASVVVCINSFYDYIDHHDISNKLEKSVSLGNAVIDRMYSAYQKMFLQIFSNNKSLQDKAYEVFKLDKELVKPNELFNPIQSMQALFKFSKLSWRNKNITDKEFNQIFYNTIFASYFIIEFYNTYRRFTLNYKS